MDYKEAKERIKSRINYLALDDEDLKAMKILIPELAESEDERISKALIDTIRWLELDARWSDIKGVSFEDIYAWLEKKKEQKEINLVKILKHYPKETELYSPLYGKLWLAKVDDINEIITCYKHPLEKDDVRAILEQEDTVSFYSNGTTGLPDFEVSKECMLFLYNNEKQKEQKPAENSVNWTELTWKDINELEVIINNVHNEFRNGIGEENFGKEVLERFHEYKGDENLDDVEQKPAEWTNDDEKMVRFYEADYNNQIGDMSMKDVINMRLEFKNWLVNRLKSLRPKPNTVSIKDATKFGNLEYERGVTDGIQHAKNHQWKPSEEQMEAVLSAINYVPLGGDTGGCLNSLYKDLKKL